MMRRMKGLFGGIAASVLLFVGSSVAVGADDGEAVAERADKVESIANVRKRLSELFPDDSPDQISPSPVSGIYEVMVGPEVVYLSGDGRYMVRGEIIDLDTRKNLTEPRENAARVAALAAVGEENMVIFGSEKLEHTLTVFTDIDCGYCRKLHGEMASYNESGIRVRYLFFPRAGVNSDSYKKAVSTWCAEDRQEAMTRVKAGEEIESRECKNPVEDHMALGQRMGVRGTPALVLEGGEMLPGYIPAARLSNYLNTSR